MEITSLTNAKVKQWSKYKEKKHRDKDHKFLIEGEHLIEEAHKANLIECILIEQGKENMFPAYETYEVTRDILKKLSDSVSGTYIMAVCHMPNISSIDFGNKVIVLDDVQDPGNVGTIIRTAFSFGYTSIVLSNHSVDVFNEKVIRSTQGALFHMPIIRGDIMELLQELKQQGITLYATSLHEATPLQQTPKKTPCALIFGNEGNGVSKDVIDYSDHKVFIEMDTFESLNVAVAAGICMYEFK
ncbi:RNA methyltransferase [Absiella sp. AM54-8XD]|uniref:TrmH family RNA methyltransferase n=1 Tax=unclassified Amedibacterium TaxID=3088137 RepID=UPI000E419A47|nr:MULTISPECIES: RNA methyltransferase [unclassified Absiella]RGC12282.1 RNA methyltransferase [Absiella sp. AM54-8XD]RGC51945.1 RNA methyltransferase [Absiella sp. AM29-15]